MKGTLRVLKFLSFIFFVPLIAQEQIPTFNVKNKTNQELILVVGKQNVDKHTVIMRIKNQRTKKAVDYAYTIGGQIILKPGEDASLYGLNIAEVQAINCYYTVRNAQQKVVATFAGDYKTLYLKCSIKNGKLWVFAQEGSNKGLTTDGYSLAHNIKDKQITLRRPRNINIITKEKMYMLDTVSNYKTIAPFEYVATTDI